MVMNPAAFGWSANRTASKRGKRRELRQVAQVRIRVHEVGQEIASRMNLPYGRSVAQNRRVGPDPLREIFSPPRKAALLPQARFLVDLQDIEVVLHHRHSAVDFSPCHDWRSLLRSHPERAHFHNRPHEMHAPYRNKPATTSPRRGAGIGMSRDFPNFRTAIECLARTSVLTP